MFTLFALICEALIKKISLFKNDLQKGVNNNATFAFLEASRHLTSKNPREKNKNLQN